MSFWDWAHQHRKNLAYVALATALGAGLYTLSPENPNFSKLPPAVQDAIKKENDALRPKFDEVKNQIIRENFDVARRTLDETRKSVRGVKSTGFPVSVALDEIAVLDKCLTAAEGLAKSKSKYAEYADKYLRNLDKETLKLAIVANEDAMKYSNDLLVLARTNLFSLIEKRGFHAIVESPMVDMSHLQVKIMATFSSDKLKFSKDDASILTRQVHGNMESTQLYLRQARHV